MVRLLVAATFVALLLIAAPVPASDGVIEINQASATAGGVTPGDTPGFPVTLSAPGSYRLTGNLSVPANTTAIQITASNVTLDLGGFEVKGPNTCTGFPVTSCAVELGAAGIHADASQVLVFVRNGRVSGMAGACVNLLGSSSRVEKVVASLCGFLGISVGPYGRVSESIALAALGDGIFVGTGGAAHDNEVRGNSGRGVNVGEGNLGATLTANRALENRGVGIFAGPSALVMGNRATGNLGDGLSTGTGSTVKDNTVSGNAGDGIEVGLYSTVIGNTIHNNARCGLNAPVTSSCPFCRSGYANNVINLNNGSPVNRQVNYGADVDSQLRDMQIFDGDADESWNVNVCSGATGGLAPCLMSSGAPSNNCP